MSSCTENTSELIIHSDPRESLHGNPATSLHGDPDAQQISEPSDEIEELRPWKLLKESLEKALSDPTCGPRPITLEDYRRRSASKRLNILKETSKEESPKKPRAGLEAKFRKLIGEYHRLAVISTGSQKQNFVRKIKELQKERNTLRKIKRERKAVMSKLNN